MNTQQFVNMPTGAVLQRALAAQLGALLTEVQWARHKKPGPTSEADLVIEVTGPAGRRRSLMVHVKAELRPSVFPAWARSTPRPTRTSVPVLAMPSVSPRLAELCRREGWSWLDLAGNCRLDVPGLLHIERSGRSPVRRQPRRGSNLGTAAAARVIRVLLSPAHAGRTWTQRSLQTNTVWHLPDSKPVSLGLVNKVVQHLRDEGFLDPESSGLRVKDPRGLLTAWRESYRFDAHQRLQYFTLLKREQLGKALDNLRRQAGGSCLYAAFSAAEHQAPQVRQSRTWVYVSADHLDALVQHTEAKPVDSGENLVVLVPDDPGVFLSFEPAGRSVEQHLGCTDPVQTYVDLYKLDGRGQDAAQAILEQRLMKAWKAAGLE